MNHTRLKMTPAAPLPQDRRLIRDTCAICGGAVTTQRIVVIDDHSDQVCERCDAVAYCAGAHR